VFLRGALSLLSCSLVLARVPRREAFEDGLPRGLRGCAQRL
jgi:hypothetical protein